jgi:hypothetical protein
MGNWLSDRSCGVWIVGPTMHSVQTAQVSHSSGKLPLSTAMFGCCCLFCCQHHCISLFERDKSSISQGTKTLSWFPQLPNSSTSHCSTCLLINFLNHSLACWSQLPNPLACWSTSEMLLLPDPTFEWSLPIVILIYFWMMMFLFSFLVWNYWQEESRLGSLHFLVFRQLLTQSRFCIISKILEGHCCVCIAWTEIFLINSVFFAVSHFAMLLSGKRQMS